MSELASVPAPTWFEHASIFRPRLPAFWLFVLLLIVGALGTGSGIAARLSAAPTSSLLAIVLLTAWAVPFVFVIYQLDLFEREPFGMLMAAFAWGALVATQLAVSANTALVELVAKLGSPALANRWGAAIAGPTDEETLKALGLVLLVLIAAAEIDTPVDGLVYGAFAGLGFQIVEDFAYFTNPIFAGNGFSQTDVVWQLFIVRALVAGLWTHAVYTGLVGLGIGYLVSRRDVPRERRVALAVLAFAGAWLLHFVWNSPWLAGWFGNDWREIVAVSMIKGLPGLLLLLGLYLHARRREARWVERILIPEVATGAVTPAEIQALLTLHGRRHERRAARRRGGRRAARLTKLLQREQVALAVDLTRSRGASTPQVARHRAMIAFIRDALRKLEPRPPRRAPIG